MNHFLRLLFVLGLVVTAGSAPAQERPFDDPPLQLRSIPPVYPESLKAEGPAGIVTVLVSIDEEGNVTGTKILRSSHKDFEQPATEAAMQYKFRPAKKAGKPVAVSIVIPVRFEKPS